MADLEFSGSVDFSEATAPHSDRTVTVLDVATAKPVIPPLPHGSLVREMKFVRDGRALLGRSVTDMG